MVADLLVVVTAGDLCHYCGICAQETVKATPTRRLRRDRVGSVFVFLFVCVFFVSLCVSLYESLCVSLYFSLLSPTVPLWNFH